MTDNFNGFVGRAKRLDDIDLPTVGSTIGVGEDEIHAFMDVEAAGHGFDSQGRPKMLFEPHLFHAALQHDTAKLKAAVQANVAYPRWGMKPYPKESYSRLAIAMEIDAKAAIRSASWGLSQILGSNYAGAGFESPEAMVRAFMDDEENHLVATVRLLVTMGIDDDLRKHRWPIVARVWNGPGYKKNRYDTKLEAAFAKWRKIKDTPFTLDVLRNPKKAARKP